MNFLEWRWNRVLVIFILFLILYMALPVYLLLILSILLSLLLLPTIKRIENLSAFSSWKMDTRRNISIVITFALAFMIIGLTFFLTFKPLLAELTSFIALLPEAVNAFRFNLIRFLSENQGLYFALPTQIKDIIDSGTQQFLTFVITWMNSLLQLLIGTTPMLIQAVLLPFLVYYFLRDRDFLLKEVVECAPVRRRRDIKDLLAELGTMLSHYIRGQLMVCAIVGLIIFMGTSVLDVRYPLVLGILAFLLESIPYAGPILSFIPAFLLACSVSFDLALKVTLFYVFVSFLENYIIVPKIMGQVTKTHPLVILLGMLLAANWFGIIGMMLAVPAMAALRILIRFIWNWRP